MTSLIGSITWNPLADVSPNLWSIAGWTMFHYLWIGLLLLVIAAAGRRLLRRAMPQVRYAYGLAWLSILALLPPLGGGSLAAHRASCRPGRTAVAGCGGSRIASRTTGGDVR